MKEFVVYNESGQEYSFNTVGEAAKFAVSKGGANIFCYEYDNDGEILSISVMLGY